MSALSKLKLTNKMSAMRLLSILLGSSALGLLVGCTDDPIEKCVTAQVKLAAERAKKFESEPPPPPQSFVDKLYGVTPPSVIQPDTPAEAEARARLMCLKAASGKT
ncbi:MAG TPA: hypothetical protein PKH72_13385 [Rhodoferax sp.]|jgi:hypothetical protein|nr:hypothetical protein [Rhodoferax sp.]HNV60640.1 hypothetical protein [Rhodoferax sp.]HPW27992.1 hypothetical protein [Rhodoferax sp.]